VDSITAEKRWKQPLTYFLLRTGGMRSNEIITLLEICLTKLKETCDRRTNNQKVYRDLGVTEKVSHKIKKKKSNMKIKDKNKKNKKENLFPNTYFTLTTIYF
jgi:hypothetical protein